MSPCVPHFHAGISRLHRANTAPPRKIARVRQAKLPKLTCEITEIDELTPTRCLTRATRVAHTCIQLWAAPPRAHDVRIVVYERPHTQHARVLSVQRRGCAHHDPHRSTQPRQRSPQTHTPCNRPMSHIMRPLCSHSTRHVHLMPSICVYGVVEACATEHTSPHIHANAANRHTSHMSSCVPHFHAAIARLHPANTAPPRRMARGVTPPNDHDPHRPAQPRQRCPQTHITCLPVYATFSRHHYATAPRKHGSPAENSACVTPPNDHVTLSFVFSFFPSACGPSGCRNEKPLKELPGSITSLP